MDKKTILIVDDTPENITLISALLKDAYQTKIATHGEKAVEIATAGSNPDLILLDIMMPEIDGYEVCRRLKADEKTRPIPVIFLTAMTDSEDEEKGFELGAVDYITKPIRPAILRARVKTHLELKESRDLLEEMASTDNHTGIANRRRFDHVMAYEWKRALRGRRALSIAMIDIDYFKKYNDAYGHGNGDACLRSVAQAMQEAVRRPGELLARYGGEEFVVILPEVDEAGLQLVLQNMLDRVAALAIPHNASTASPVVSISMGAVSMLPHDEVSFEAALEQADKLLYMAKSGGRSRCVVQTAGGQPRTLTVTP